MDFTEKTLDLIDQLVTVNYLGLVKGKHKRVNHWFYEETPFYPCKQWSPTRNPDCFMVLMDALPVSIQVFKFITPSLTGNQYKVTVLEEIPGEYRSVSIDAVGPTPAIALCLTLLKLMGITTSELEKVQ